MRRHDLERSKKGRATGKSDSITSTRSIAQDKKLNRRKPVAHSPGR